ncbi:ORF47A [Silurid herpesvirus 1]|nr:ORF47A [Silurid herpesvirus 1]
MIMWYVLPLVTTMGLGACTNNTQLPSLVFVLHDHLPKVSGGDELLRMGARPLDLWSTCPDTQATRPDTIIIRGITHQKSKRHNYWSTYEQRGNRRVIVAVDMATLVRGVPMYRVDEGLRVVVASWRAEDLTHQYWNLRDRKPRSFRSPHAPTPGKDEMRACYFHHLRNRANSRSRRTTPLIQVRSAGLRPGPTVELGDCAADQFMMDKDVLMMGETGRGDVMITCSSTMGTIEVPLIRGSPDGFCEVVAAPPRTSLVVATYMGRVVYELLKNHTRLRLIHIQRAIVEVAEPPEDKTDWTVNPHTKKWTHPKYGFGEVRLERLFPVVKRIINEGLPTKRYSARLCQKIEKLEWVEIYIVLKFNDPSSRTKAINLTLTSPSKTDITIWYDRVINPVATIEQTLFTNRLWGEPTGTTWGLRLEDEEQGNITRWGVFCHGPPVIL